MESTQGLGPERGAERLQEGKDWLADGWTDRRTGRVGMSWVQRCLGGVVTQNGNFQKGTSSSEGAS